MFERMDTTPTDLVLGAWLHGTWWCPYVGNATWCSMVLITGAVRCAVIGPSWAFLLFAPHGPLLGTCLLGTCPSWALRHARIWYSFTHWHHCNRLFSLTWSLLPCSVLSLTWLMRQRDFPHMYFSNLIIQQTVFKLRGYAYVDSLQLICSSNPTMLFVFSCITIVILRGYVNLRLPTYVTHKQSSIVTGCL